MKRISVIFATLILLCGCEQEKYIKVTGYAQGGTYSITCSVSSNVSTHKIKEDIDMLLQSIDFSISGYNKGSLLSRINAGEDPVLDSIFIGLFNRSREIWVKSRGAFDPSAAPLFDLWGFGFEDGRVSDSAVDSVKSFVGMDLFSIENNTSGESHLIKKDSRCKLNFNAIAQGYSCDLIASLIEDRYNSKNYIIELGGEIVCQGISPRGNAWRIWIDKPVDGNDTPGAMKQDILEVKDGGVVTSGNYRKYYIKEGKKLAHTINPLTGRPVEHTLLSATILADDSATADAYATWMMVVGLEKAQQIIPSLQQAGENVEAYLVWGDSDGSTLSVWHTPGMKLESEYGIAE